MEGHFFQIVITIWLTAHPYRYTPHPVRYTLPTIYFDHEKCEARVKRFKATHKPTGHAEIECVATDRQNI